MKLNTSHVSNLLFLLFLILMLVPQSRMWIQVNLTRLVAWSPSKNKKMIVLPDYNLALQGVNTEDVNLKSAAGQVIVVNFWATWCPPCVAEMPSLQELYTTYKEDDRIAFFLISEEESTDISSFLEKNAYSVPTYIPRTQIPEKIDTSSLPTTYVIDKTGRIVITHTGAADWNSSKVKKIIEELLADNPDTTEEKSTL